MDCAHQWSIDNHNIGVCTVCNKVRQYPWEKGEVVVLKKGNPSINKVSKEEHMEGNIKERHRYYEEHKDEIIADLKTIGRTPTRKKWNIPAGGAIVSLLKRWLTQEERDAISLIKSKRGPKQKGNIPPRQGTLAPSANGDHPKFPEFSNEWVPAVQLKWFDLYEKLLAEDNAPTPPSTAVAGHAEL